METIIKNANIIPMTEERVLINYDLLLENGAIKGIERNIIRPGAETIDCTGKYVMPGLFDMHVHLDAPSMPGILFANGVTGVRNMWGYPHLLKWKKDLEKGEMIGPRIYTTGPLTDGLNTWEGCNVVTTPGEAERAVRNVVEEGYDYFKSYPDIKKEVFIRLMETANRLGIKVVGHGNNNVSIDELINLGYYSLEHTSRLPKNEDDIIKLAKSGMWFTPTHFVLTKVDEYVLKRMDIALTPNGEYVSEIRKRKWDQATNIRRNDARYEKFDLKEFIRLAKVFIAHSDRILLGSDTVNPGVIPGFSIHEELREMVDSYGVKPYQALVMGTVNAAKSLGVENKFGKIEVDKAADLLILDENPLVSIENSQRIFAVAKSGKIFRKTDLEKILKECKRLIENEDNEAVCCEE